MIERQPHRLHLRVVHLDHKQARTTITQKTDGRGCPPVTSFYEDLTRKKLLIQILCMSFKSNFNSWGMNYT